MPTMRERRERESIAMTDVRLPFYMLRSFELNGAEDPPQGGNEGTEGEDGAGDGGDGGDGGDDGENSGTENTPEDAAGLKSALEKERRANQAKERELKRLRKAEEERTNSEKTEVQRATDEAQKAKSRAERLAQGFLREKLDNAIRTAAAKSNFHDPEDAILAVDRETLSYEQDDDDPSNVTIDKKTVENAVKKVATSKPHLIKSGTSDGGATGGQFGGAGRGGQGEANEETYRSRYSAL